MSSPDQEQSPEYQAYLDGEAKKISEPHIAMIPAEDRNRIANKTHAEFILSMHEGSSDQFSTTDRMGNLPESIQMPHNKEDRPATIQALRDFAADPMAHATEVFTYYSKKGVLPEALRTQMEEIILLEGKNRLGEMFAQLADRLEADPSGDMSAIWQKSKSELPSREADGIRKMAIKQMVEAVYPDLMTSPEVALLLEAQEIPFENLGNPEIVAGVAKKFQELTGDSSFAQYADAEVLRQKLGSKELKDYDLEEIPLEIKRALKEKIAEKFVSAEK